MKTSSASVGSRHLFIEPHDRRWCGLHQQRQRRIENPALLSKIVGHPQGQPALQASERGPRGSGRARASWIPRSERRRYTRQLERACKQSHGLRTERSRRDQ
jgi:hypothetical protein